MNAHSLKVLDFDALKAKIADFSVWDKGKEAIMAIAPFSTLDPVLKRQTEVSEASGCLKAAGMVPLEGLKDLEPILWRAAKGGVLEGPEIWDTGQFLGICSRVKKYISAHHDLAPNLLNQIRSLTLHPNLEREIKQTLTPEGKVQDNATPALSDIRHRIVNLEQQIHQKLKHIMRHQAYKNMLQEPIFTFREGHFVLPVKQEYRSKFPGVYFDRSLSGATLFMEPLAIIDAGNYLREAFAEQKEERQRILKELSLEIASCSEELRYNLQSLAWLDMTFALAGFGLKYDCILPRINTDGYVKLDAARHPLLTVKPVPIDIETGKDFIMIILTGPNTGGKTVTLKTLGLMVLMGLSGMPLPAGDLTTIPLIEDIFADIGDEQSLTSNLSTFSSHISNIISWLPRLNESTLVLIDELGAGTDPAEGTALGIALLEYLLHRNTRVLASTHYGELKTFASRHNGVINAAMEFDAETLQPVYKVTLGVPGRSCALAVAKRLGMPEAILSQARTLAHQEQQNLEELLTDIKKTQQEAELQRQNFRRLKAEYEEKLKHSREQEAVILNQAALEAAALIQTTKTQLEQLLKSAHQACIGTGAERKPQSGIHKTAAKYRSMLKDLEQSHALTQKLPPAEHFNPGDWVYILELQQQAQVLAAGNPDEVLVSIKGKRLGFKPHELKAIEPPEAKDMDTTGLSLEKKLHISDSLNLRGMRVEEALAALEKYMDDALLANLSAFNIIHGKGEGILRKAVHQYLKASPVVKGYQLADYYAGGRGVTIVELK